MNKIPEEIETHVNGKRFKRLRQEYEERKNKPSVEENEGDENLDGSVVGSYTISHCKSFCEVFDFSKASEELMEKMLVEESEVEGEEDDEDSLDDLMGSDHEEENEKLLLAAKTSKFNNAVKSSSLNKPALKDQDKGKRNTPARVDKLTKGAEMIKPSKGAVNKRRMKQGGLNKEAGRPIKKAKSSHSD